MKIAIRFGHMLTGADTGAVGYLKEAEVNRQYGPVVIKYLQIAGHEVINCTPETASSVSDSLSKGVNKANANKCDIFVSLHSNSSSDANSSGCEVIYHHSSSVGRELAIRICKSISEKCGYYNRGAKSEQELGRDLYELRATNMPAVIVEPFFVTNKADCSKFDPEKLGKAVAEGIVGHDIREVKIVDVNQALKILVEKGVITTPEYWQTAANIVKYLDVLLINMAKKLV